MKTMRLLGLSLFAAILLAGCSSKSDVKNESEILKDLEECHFVLQYIDQTYTLEADLTDTLDDDFYTITDLSILSRETEKGENDIVTIEVNAKSDIASYCGRYRLNYRYQKKEGFQLDSIENIAESNLYYDLTPPDESLVLDFYNEHPEELYWYGEPTALADVSVKKKIARVKKALTPHTMPKLPVHIEMRSSIVPHMIPLYTLLPL